MSTHSRRSSLAGYIALVLFTAMLLPTITLARPLGQGQSKEESQDKKQKSKDDKSKDEKPKADTPKVSKEEREYQKIRKFSQERYNSNADFRDEVDEAYRQKQREHSEYAYLINTRDADDELTTRTGDKVKIEDTLYDNPLAQDYVNRVGQSLVPTNSTRLYAFKITLNPVPEARSLSTGTVYVSSGLLSLIDNEAQLAYILGHEIAHVEKDHWREDVLVAHGVDEYNEKQQKRRNILGAVIGTAASVIGINGGGAGQLIGTAAIIVAPSVLKLVVRDAVVSWDRMQEDEADQLGLKYMLERNYDPHEVPKFYANMRQTTQRDQRARLGFIADSRRVDERMELVNLALGTLTSSSQTLYVGALNLAARRLDNATPSQPPAAQQAEPGKPLDPSRNTAEREAAALKAISGELSADIQAKLDAGELIGTSAEFASVMAGLKRDNGVRAYYYDMFQMARDNLEESLRIRSNDPYAHFYYGKVLKLTARNMAEKSRALNEFVRAIDLDKRRVLPESHLYRALSLIEGKDPNQMRDIVTSLKEYVSLYQREHSGTLPPNMDVIYDYMQEAGEMTWTATPAINVSTKNIEPIGVSSAAGTRTPVTTMPVNNTGSPATNPAIPETAKPPRRRP
ncbi:MAG TPA: M48 family metalloprotease [Pyrinomonadaceae bacterium]|jgi:Zn-dependent protease with chaperone function|nr:M48 family metalloprotease [Pyrinomonadaceae bacterium]